MSNQRRSSRFRSLRSLAEKLRKDLRGVHKRKKTAKRKGTSAVKPNDYILIFAHNGVGKTRLSMEFKDIGKKEGKRDTLYYNAFTEDLFDWENDLNNDKERKLKYKSHSHFFDGIDGLGLEDQIRPYLQRYADFNFTIDYEKGEVSFFREEIIKGRSETIENIKISRGEENVFIWCFFLAIARLAIEAEKGQPYDWVKFIYIDDPISSLDEHNSIAVASELAELMRSGKDKVKFVVSTHHGLFFNVMFNELKSGRSPTGEILKLSKRTYVLHRSEQSKTFSTYDTGESPFLHHVTVLTELQKAAKSGKIFLHHFNMLRGLLEKTAIFFGRQHISTCFDGLAEKGLYSRILNVKSHERFSVYEPKSLHASEKKAFREILKAFIDRYPFNPALLPSDGPGAPTS